MALLLLAGLVQVPEDARGGQGRRGHGVAAPVEGRSLPNMKAAIMVAVLFRTLDAFRIFDNIYVMTRGANDTESVSILGLPPERSRG